MRILGERSRRRLTGAGLFWMMALAPALAGDGRESQAPDVPDAGRLTGEGLTGDWGGARARLKEAGVSIGLSATANLSANPVGGEERGRGYSGLFQAAAELDLEKLAGWKGGSFYVEALLIGGHGLSGKFLGNLMPASNIEADPAGRLGEAYLQQELLDGRLSLRIGQLEADGEFATSETAGLFVNSAFGWPGLHDVVLPGGGPAYPAPAPGVRVAFTPAEGWLLQAGVYSGDPRGRKDNNRHGLTFPLNDGVFVIAEAGYTHDFGDGLTGAYKMGAWYNSLSFDDLRFGRGGRLLGDPDNEADPVRHRGNYAIYVVIDQTLWRRQATGAALAAFARVAVAPASRRSHVDFYADAGLTYTGLPSGRSNDAVGLAVAYARGSRALAGLDRDMIGFTGEAVPVRSSEIVIEASWQAEVTPWLKVQPSVQWIIRPGAGKPHTGRPLRRIPDAAVVSLRTMASF